MRLEVVTAHRNESEIRNSLEFEKLSLIAFTCSP